MVPDHADDLGRLAIDQLCLGRGIVFNFETVIINNFCAYLGGSISTLVTVTDKRPDFMLIRPLCDISKKELAVYNYLCDIDKHCIHIAQQNNQQKSVQTLTDAFICTLENEKFYVRQFYR